MKFGKMFGVVAIAALSCLVASSAHAAPIALSDGSWADFTWADGLGPIDSPADGYTYTSATPFDLRVVDCCVVGDQFTVHVTGSASFDFTTSDPSANDGLVTADIEDTAWADPFLSKGSVVLGPGTYQFGIDVIRLAADLSTGGQYQSGLGSIRADTAVPEPASLMLLGTGIVGLVARRRMRGRK